jgi:hypothetical protein
MARAALQQVRLLEVAGSQRLHPLAKAHHQPLQLVAAAQRPDPRVTPAGEGLQVAPQHQHRPGHPVRQHHPEHPEREGHEGGDAEQRPEQLAVAARHQGAHLGVEGHELGGLQVGLVEPEAAQERQQRPRAGQEQGVAELEAPVDQVAAAVVGRGAGRSHGCVGHAMLPSGRGFYPAGQGWQRPGADPP